jgi:hypothetical protein
MPTEGGSTGSWDTILNALLVELDAQVKTNENKADDALAENLSFPLFDAAALGQFSIDQTTVATSRNGPGGGVTLVQTSPATQEVLIQIHGLAPGMRITGFKSRGQAPTGTSCSVVLSSVDATGTVTIHSTHSHGSTLQTLTKTGLSIDVAADRTYYFRVPLGSVSNDGATIYWVQPTVTRP